MLSIAETPVEETKLPRYALFRGKKVRLVAYSPKTTKRPAYFVIIDTDDVRRNVFRSSITFLPERKKS